MLDALYACSEMCSTSCCEVCSLLCACTQCWGLRICELDAVPALDCCCCRCCTHAEESHRMSNQSAQNGLNAARNAALLLIVPTAHTVWHAQLHHMSGMNSCHHCLLLRHQHTPCGADLLIQRQHTLGPMPALLASSTCLQPLNRASMTRVLVTSFSLKKRFTSPCAMWPCDVTQCLLKSCYTVVTWLTCMIVQVLFATTASAVYRKAITTWEKRLPT